jgi:UDP-N-acetyl-D-glucosamine dehydrogenase
MGRSMKRAATLRDRILDRQASVAVVGQGYVGLTLACVAADEGFPVVGIDIDAARIADLGQGRLSVPGVPERTYQAGFRSGRLRFTTDLGPLGSSDITLICVPTPLQNHTPDLSNVESACRAVAATLKPGQLVVLESTTYPGTTDDLVRTILQTSGLNAGRDFLLAYSPERIDPGNDEFDLRNTPKVVGGCTSEATELAALFYSQLVYKVISASSCRAAELAKLLENTFRLVNIALVNELAMLCHDMAIDIWEVVDIAATKPFGFMPFYPGPGVGGHCIPLDPEYLAWHVRRDAGRHFRILEQAQDVNAQVPAYVAGRIAEALNELGKAVKGSSILVLGVSYKPDVGDLRESASIKVMEHLHRRGARVTFHDPYVERVAINGLDLKRTRLTTRSVQASDCTAVLTPHSSYDLEWVASNAALVFDARNAYGPADHANVTRL